MKRVALLLLIAACEPKGAPTAGPATGGGEMLSASPTGDFDAGAATRSTLSEVTKKGTPDGRYVVSAIVVRVEGTVVEATDDFADSATWKLKAPDIADAAKRFQQNGRYRLLVLIQNGEPRIIDGGPGR